MSTIDLVGRGFTLMAGAQAQWTDAAERIAAEFGLALRVHRIGRGGELEDPGRTWERAYGVAPTDASLVRPDGFIAWRSGAGDDQLTGLRQALARVCARENTPTSNGVA